MRGGSSARAPAAVCASAGGFVVRDGYDRGPCGCVCCAETWCCRRYPRRCRTLARPSARSASSSGSTGHGPRTSALRSARRAPAPRCVAIPPRHSTRPSSCRRASWGNRWSSSCATSAPAPLRGRMRAGLGFGLRLIEHLSADAEVAAPRGGGLRVTMRFPLRAAAPGADSSRGLRHPAHGLRATPSGRGARRVPFLHQRVVRDLCAYDGHACALRRLPAGVRLGAQPVDPRHDFSQILLRVSAAHGSGRAVEARVPLPRAISQRSTGEAAPPATSSAAARPPQKSGSPSHRRRVAPGASAATSRRVDDRHRGDRERVGRRKRALQRRCSGRQKRARRRDREASTANGEVRRSARSGARSVGRFRDSETARAPGWSHATSYLTDRGTAPSLARGSAPVALSARLVQRRDRLACCAVSVHQQRGQLPPREVAAPSVGRTAVLVPRRRRRRR